MSYWLKSLIGAALFLGAVVLFNVKLLDLMQTGTCASGGPYVSARPCPPGTGTDVLLLMASIFAGLIGAWIFALRGVRPGGSGRGGGGFSDGLLAWSVYFVGTGAYALYSVLTDDSLEPDATTGGLIVSGTFLLLGLPALVALIWLWAIHRDDPPVDDRFSPSTPQSLVSQLAAARSATSGWTPTPAPIQTAPAPDAGPDPIAQVERLQRLRESGALTEAEFEAQKRRVLGS